jgi:hypothetical protein
MALVDTAGLERARLETGVAAVDWELAAVMPGKLAQANPRLMREEALAALATCLWATGRN